MVDETEKTPKQLRAEKARARKIMAAENRAKAVEYRKMGMSYKAIGEQLDMSAQAAHKTVTKALTLVKVQQDADASTIKIAELENLDRMQLAMWPAMTKGSPQAVDRLLKIQERRAKLMGLDAPLKTAQTDSQGKDLPTRSDMSDEELTARTKELEDKFGADQSGA